MIYNLVGCGGTFDKLHTGHKAFLRFVFSHGKNVLIGLTSEKYVSIYKNDLGISSFAIRQKALENFLLTEGFSGRYNITPIDTVFGPADDPQIFLDALITTEETRKGAEEINAKRDSMGLYKLPIITMPLVVKNGNKISSSRIRAGEIDAEGNVYSEEFAKELLLLPEGLRTKLQTPFGTLYVNTEQVFQNLSLSTAVVVGDETTTVFHAKHLFPKLAIVDFVVQRKKTYDSLIQEGFSGSEQHFSVSNPPGSITPALWETIKKAVINLKKGDSTVITVDGEEDLAVLPLVLVLPLGFTIYYGQPGKGIVQVTVNEDTKERAKGLLRQFKRA
ncbi:MAG: pantetheine-phosphate adenylyltransferase [Patescibacteria group bacterium]|nr:pantetheine-phosphate adenylyltransferase [Patescibacteria group bacterium]MDE2590878.1 pantetheine-phosphate adenylyltransferase [Patescibacteria group bacterium]